MPILTESELKNKYNLPNYHVPFLLKANELLDFRNKKVLEVGGSLPRDLVIGELQASQWVGIEQLDYWQEIQAANPTTSTQSIQFSNYDSIGNYQILTGSIEDIPQSFYQEFDIVFSIATFDHIHKLPAALDQMYKCLKVNGKLFSLFSPIWSAHDGHHLPNSYTENGEKFNFSNNPIPPWGHLLMRPMEIYDLLVSKFDRKFAQEVVYYIFQSNHINRYFFKDYTDVIERSKFQKKDIHPLFPMEIPNMIQEALIKKYGDQDFSHNGMLALLHK